MMDALVARPQGIKDKRDAVAWALVLSTGYNGCNHAGCVNLGDAQLIYDFITKNVNLPEVDRDGIEDVVRDLGTVVRKMADMPIVE